MYREHPEWAVEIPGKRGVLMRNQLLLDLVNKDVQQYIIRVISDILNSANISYVKWDHNRFIANQYSRTLSADRQYEFSHRYMLGLYKIMTNITKAFPHILFESCAGGGGRFDPASLAFMPQTWSSDNTDADERVKIQWGFSYVYPLSMVGAHVSKTPNEQVKRVTSWESCASVAHFGTFGYELNMIQFSDKQKMQATIESEAHKEIQRLIHKGKWYRLRSPYRSNWPGWMCVSDIDCAEAVVFAYQKYQRTRETCPSLILKGIDSHKEYYVSSFPIGSEKMIFSGDELMTRGMVIPFSHDFEGRMYYIRTVESS